MREIDFNELNKLGLIYEINNKILHPLGLSLNYDPETGKSSGALIIEKDSNFEYDEIITNENKLKLAKFKQNRIKVLKKY